MSSARSREDEVLALLGDVPRTTIDLAAEIGCHQGWVAAAVACLMKDTTIVRGGLVPRGRPGQGSWGYYRVLPRGVDVRPV